MSMTGMVTLTREVRFALGQSEGGGGAGSTNGFAGEPALTGIAPFLTLTIALSGEVDRATGMLINIKIVDRILRAQAVPLIERQYKARAGAAAVVQAVARELRARFAPHTLRSVTLGLSPFLSLCVDPEEPDVVQLSQRFEFSAAHRLHADGLSDADNREIFGRCNNPSGHGHNYELEVTIAGKPDEAGHVMPLYTFQKLVNDHVIEVFDHKHLNVDCPEFARLNPTVENIAGVIYEKLRAALPGHLRLARVKVWETPKTSCEVVGA